MPNKCVAVGCSSGHHKQTPSDVTFHRFPKKEEIRQIWIRRVAIQDFYPKESHRLCSLHFTDSDFTEISSDTNSTRKRRRTDNYLSRRALKQDAIPSLFPNLPSSTPTPRRSNKTTSDGRLESQN